MSTVTPLLIVGDGPQEPTGLGRIVRDLGLQIRNSALPVELVTVGGSVPPVWPAWPHYPLDERLHRGDDWGASYVDQIYQSHFGDRPGVLWVIWDPSRLAAYKGLQSRVRIWSYPAIDGSNRNGTIGGPAAEAVRDADRVIAYGRWASTILKTVRTDAVPYLPHGINPYVFNNDSQALTPEWARAELGPYVKQADKIIGCVATNQPRKDLALFCGTLRALLERGHAVYGWLHSDVPVKAWSIPQLVEDFGLQKKLTVSLTEYDDLSLAAFYKACSVTAAPGLGEGFGYPIVESLAAGVPVVHGDCAGGRELVPARWWRFPVREVRLESVYGIQRPVFRADDVANAIERIWAWEQAVGRPAVQAYCQGAVAHLEWSALWPRWQAWIRAGL